MSIVIYGDKYDYLTKQEVAFLSHIKGQIIDLEMLTNLSQESIKKVKSIAEAPSYQVFDKEAGHKEYQKIFLDNPALLKYYLKRDAIGNLNLITTLNLDKQVELLRRIPDLPYLRTLLNAYRKVCEEYEMEASDNYFKYKYGKKRENFTSLENNYKELITRYHEATSWTLEYYLENKEAFDHTIEQKFIQYATEQYIAQLALIRK